MKSARPASTFRSPARGATLGCLLLLCALPIASSAQSSDPSQVVEHVHGVVINAVDRKPIARALVSTGDQRMATMTDSDGRFTFDVRRPSANPSHGNTNSVFPAAFQGSMMGGSVIGLRGSSQTTIYLMARRPGYLQNQSPMHLSSDPQGASEPVELRLIPEAILRGHLSVSNSAKPSNLVVQLRRKQVQDGVAGWVQVGGVQANSHGDYNFADLPAGDYKLMSQAWTEQGFGRSSSPDEVPGYAPAYYADAFDLASSPVIHLTAGQTAEANLNLRAATFYHVTVPVPGLAKGDGVNVTVGNQQDMSGLFMNYNPQTQTVDGFLPNGSYDLRLTSFGQPPTAGISRVEVAGKPVKNRPIALAPTGQIPVIVHQEYTTSDSNQSSRYASPQMAQRRLLNITMRPVNLDGPWAGLRNPTSKDDQELVFDNVLPGDYRVIPTPTRGYVAAMSANGVDLLHHPLVVGPGGAGGPIEVTLRDDAATLTGTITPSNAAPAQPDPDAIFAILCIPLDAGSASPMPAISQQGKFTIPNLAPGEYLVLALGLRPEINTLPSIEYQNPDVLREYQTKGTTITLSSGQKAEIQVPLLPNPDGGN